GPDWRARSSRPESGDSCGFPALDWGLRLATMPRLPDKGGVGQSLYLDTGAPSGRSGYDESLRASLGLWRESEAFLRRVYERRSLKTQQRSTSRPHRSLGTGEETNNLSQPFGVGL